ncbi:MAG: DUF3857 domain-containing protein [Terriglobales bacterium]
MCDFAQLSAAVNADPANASAKAALAQYYVSRKQFEKAAVLLRQAVAAAPNDALIRMRQADLHAAVGLKSVALVTYRELARSPHSPLLDRELAARFEEIGELDQALALAEAAVSNKVDDGAAREIMVRILERRGDSTRLRACYNEMTRLSPADAQAWLKLAELDAAQGHFGEAESSARKAVAIAPGSVAARETLANVLDMAGKPSAARDELARALSLDPAAETLRRRLQWRTGANDPDNVYLADAVGVAAKVQKAPSNDTASTIALADVRVERIFDNGLSSVRVQQLFLINTEQGAHEYATRHIQYSALSQKLTVLAARAYKSNGRIVEAEENGDSTPDGGAGAMYYDARSRVLRFPGLEKGDVLDLEYRLSPESNTNPYGRYFGDLVTFRSSQPVRLQRYVLIAPASEHFNIVEARMPAATVQEQDGRRTYQWEMRDTAPLPTEPRGPALTEIAPYVHVSSFDSWQDLGRWYAQLIAPQFALDPPLRGALQKVLAGKNTEQEKIQAIHQFVLRNTHYVALEFGIYGYKPYPVSQVYARRFGDCKDKASLMIALLRAAGIDADIALVRTRRLGEISERAASISIFNHAIVYVPKYDLWLDGTAEYAGSRELPLDDQGAMALTVALDGSAQLRRVPATLPMENYTHRQVHARIEPDGRIDFTGSAYTRGEDAPGLRREYEVAERQRDSVRNRLAEVLSSVRVDNVQVYGANDLERDVTVKFEGAVDMFAGRPTLSLSPSWMQRSYVQTLAALPSRSEDLLLPAPWTTEEELHFALPAGARLQSLPQDKMIEAPFGSAVLRYQRQGDELVVTTSVQFRKLRIAPGEYAAFRAFCAQVETAFREEIKVVLRG